MIHRHKPKFKSLIYISAFTEKIYYKISREFNLKRRPLNLLILCIEYQCHTNRLVTGGALRLYAPYTWGGLNNVTRNKNTIFGSNEQTSHWHSK